MLEIMRVLSTTEEALANDVIFLFNGAEEAGLIGSHLFVDQHTWANDVGVFINLEAAGAGGREMLFQCGPGKPWILDAYLKNAPYPSASVISQELFESGLIPSDTDFRIFRDFGQFSGLDIAFVKNGYVYHTKHDSLDQIPLGSIQRAGDNVLEVTRALARMGTYPTDNLEEKVEGPVFFEFLGFFSLSYPKLVGVFFNLAFCFAAVDAAFLEVLIVSEKTNDTLWNVSKNILTVIYMRIWVLIKTLITLALLAFVMDKMNLSMGWFSKLYYVFYMYMLPYLYIFIHDFSRLQKEDKKMVRQFCFEGIQIEFVIYTLAGTYFGLKSTYLLAMWVIIPLICQITFLKLDCATGRYRRSSMYPTYTFPMLIPMFYSFYTIVLFLNFIGPLMGRFGSKINPDFIMMGLVVLMSHLSLAYTVQRIVRARDINVTKGIIAFATLVCYTLVYISSSGAPYSSDLDDIAPQRLIVLHTSRTFINTKGNAQNDHGIYIEKMDYLNSSVLDDYETFPEFRDKISYFDCTNETLFHCGLPFYNPNPDKQKKTYWVKFDKANIKPELAVSLKLVNKTKISNRTKAFFQLSGGPTAMRTFLVTSPNIKLTSWSFSSGNITDEKYKWQNWNTHAIWFITGLVQSREIKKSSHEFWLEFEDAKPHQKNEVDLKFVINGHFHHGKMRMKNVHFKQVVSNFPAWTFPWAWTVDYKVYDFALLD